MNPRFQQLLEIVTIGFPFCVFKILTGVAVLGRPWLTPLGWALIALGVIDAVVNVLNFATLAAGRARLFGICLTHILFARLRPERVEWADVGLSIDVMISFVLVASAIAFGLSGVLPDTARHLWSMAVILNVLGAGISRLSTSLGSVRARPVK